MSSESGCFVYKVLHGIGIRSVQSPEEKYRSGRGVEAGDLISIDLVIHEPTINNAPAKNGPFLRLSDGSGWLFERTEDSDIQYMQRIPVQKGLWSFYVDNDPVGLAVRYHPMDQIGAPENAQRLVLRRQPERLIPHMHKVFCDRKVEGNDGVLFYRIQGCSYAAWIFDRRVNGDSTDTLLCPEQQVQTGLFAFRALYALVIRDSASVDDSVRTSWVVKEGEVIVCDIVRESSFPDGNGPFLRLTDGSGWLFVNKEGEKMMEALRIEEGKWKLSVRNESHGIGLRKQPIDDTNSLYNLIYKENEVVLCDRMIPPNSPSGTTFFRVEGTDGWIFDKRGDHQMAVVTSVHVPVDAPSSRKCWNIEFVRGAATAVPGIEEIFFNAQSRVLSFLHPDGARINVYYSTRTIGTALDQPSQGATQLFRRDCTDPELIEILKNPRIHTGPGYYRASKKPPTETMSDESDVDIEEDLRNRLGDLENEISGLMQKRKSMLESIRPHEQKRFKNNRIVMKHRFDHIKARRAEELAANLQRQQKQEAEHKRERTCSHCGREFVDARAVWQHIEDVHSGFTCDYCGKWCRTQGALNEHKDATGHW